VLGNLHDAERTLAPARRWVRASEAEAAPGETGARVGTSSADVWRQASTDNGWAVTDRQEGDPLDAICRLPPSNHGPVIWRDVAMHLVAARGRLPRGFHRVARM
jgi:hypothetical protein